MPHKFPKDLSFKDLRKLGNIWKILSFGGDISYQVFPVLSNFAIFLCFVPNILSRIDDKVYWEHYRETSCLLVTTFGSVAG